MILKFNFMFSLRQIKRLITNNKIDSLVRLFKYKLHMSMLDIYT